MREWRRLTSELGMGMGGVVREGGEMGGKKRKETPSIG